MLIFDRKYFPQSRRTEDHSSEGRSVKAYRMRPAAAKHCWIFPVMRKQTFEMSCAPAWLGFPVFSSLIQNIFCILLHFQENNVIKMVPVLPEAVKMGYDRNCSDYSLFFYIMTKFQKKVAQIFCILYN